MTLTTYTTPALAVDHRKIPTAGDMKLYLVLVDPEGGMIMRQQVSVRELIGLPHTFKMWRPEQIGGVALWAGKKIQVDLWPIRVVNAGKGCKFVVRMRSKV